MASFETLKSGSIRASICVNGIRDKKSFGTLKKAKSWARDRESELSKLEAVTDDTRTFGDMFDRYSKEVSPKKEGAHWEILRLNLLKRDFPKLCSKKLVRSKKEDIREWIMVRSENVANSTINRELNLISHCLTMAREDWQWMSHNPMLGIKRPKNPKARSRRITEAEIHELCFVLGYRDDIEITLKREFVGAAFLFAIETAMRAGEICSLTRSDINFETKVAHLKKTKNGDERDVPLSDRAIEILRKLPALDDDETCIFQLTSDSLSTTFRKHRLQTTIEDLTFHDTRHEATTRLASQLHVLSLAKVTGHRDIKELMTYYDESAEDIGKQLRKSPQQSISLAGASNDSSHVQLAQQLLMELSKAAGLNLS